MYSDNEASIAIASNPVFHQRTKHLLIKYQYVNETINSGNAALDWIPSRDNYADMMTKPVGRNIFGDHYLYNMGGLPIPTVPNLVTPNRVLNVLADCLEKTLNLRGSIIRIHFKSYISHED